MDWATTAFVFPGQGSQSVGMGRDLAAAHRIAADTFREADDILNRPLSELMFEGEEAALAQTINTQPAMFVHSMALLRVLQREHPNAQPAMVAGHSLGEVTAITASGGLTFADGLRLVQQRATLMQQAGERASGGMAAILNLEKPTLQAICEAASAETGQIVVIANDNCPGQIVISGHESALTVAMERAKAAGAKRALRLNVSTANHSPLMQPAEDAFAQVVAATTFHDGSIPVYANLTSQAIQTAAAFQDELSRQLTRPVLWADAIRQMIADGAQTFVEVGNKDVLSGLIRRINPDVVILRISDVATLDAFLTQAS
ncbi:MAG: ACP S-malonyltransferase [Anaerolineae bacterium]